MNEYGCAPIKLDDGPRNLDFVYSSYVTKYSSLFYFFLQVFKNVKMVLSSWTMPKTGVDLARGLCLPTPDAEHLFKHVCLLPLTMSKLSLRSGIPRIWHSSWHSGRAQQACVKWMLTWAYEAIIPPSICWTLIMVSGTLLSTLCTFSHLILI